LTTIVRNSDERIARQCIGSAVIEPLETRRLCDGTALPSGFTEMIVVQDHELLTQLTAMTFAPDGRLFVLEKKGNVRVIKNDKVNATPFFSVNVKGDAERGLDGIALDPDFQNNGFVYLYYTSTASINRLVRVTADPANPDRALEGSMVVLLDGIGSETGFHNGGSMQFGIDGMLYLGTGDGGISSHASDLSSLNGKVLRLDVANYPGDLIPDDNPFIATPGARLEIWARGFRNPFTSGVDPVTGRIYINDVGGSKAEEINELTKGGDFGWPAEEGAGTNPATIDPIYQYLHRGVAEGTDSAITGGVFYRGTSFPPEYRGKYFFADYTRKFLRMLDPATGQASTFIDPQFKNTIDLDVGPDGALYALSFQWRVMKYIYRPPVPEFTPELSVSVSGGNAPLTVDFEIDVPSNVDPASLTYLWDYHDDPEDPVPGVTGESTFRHTYTTAGTHRALVTVFGGTTPVSLSADIVVTGQVNTLPKIKIAAPPKYSAGETIGFSAKVSDKEDGVLPPSSYAWSVVFHHDAHVHPFLDQAGVEQGSFVVPVRGENDPDQWYRIHLTVTDGAGQTTSAFVDVRPRLGSFTLKSTKASLNVLLDGSSVATPLRVIGVLGAERDIAAESPQTIDGVEYTFTGWSDGRPEADTIVTPRSKVFLAKYEVTAPKDIAVTRLVIPSAWGDTGRPKRPSASLSITNVGLARVSELVDLELFASADDVLDDEDVLLSQSNAVSLNLSPRKRVVKRFDGPQTLPVAQGSYFIIARIRLVDDSEANNVLAAVNAIELQ
jgi:glucose/arabinose dehydrogenase/PKD repeat protein